MAEKYIKIPDWIYYGTGSVTLTYENPDKVICSSVFFPMEYPEVETEQAKELKEELAEREKWMQKRESHFIKEMARMIETQPGRGKAIVRIKKYDTWYIPISNYSLITGEI